MAFDDIRFPVDISYGSQGGPTYLTDIVILENGAENRAAIWSVALYVYDVSYGVKTLVQLQALHEFFHGRVAQLRSFRFKDFTDFQVTQETLTITGSKTIQLTKSYDVTNPYSRIIRKPIDPITMRRATVSFTDFTLAENTGIITLTVPEATAAISDLTATITDITQASLAVVTTSAAHGFITGDIITITSVSGMTEINGLSSTITFLTSTTFRMTIDSSGFTAYTSGGTATLPGITQSNPARVHAVAHGYSTGNLIHISGISGMTEIEALEGLITVIDTDRFTIAIDSSAFTAFIDSGSPLAELYLQSGGDDLDWTGEFDVPVRFNTDQLPAIHSAFDIGAITSVPLMEVLQD
ncbi:MAG: DUF2460 domain-containing protein [Dehalococcoidales bacterium]